MFLENSFVPKNTLIHNLNPLVKFVIFLSIVFLLFLRISLLVQILLIFFAGLVAWKSDCVHICKKAVSMYLILLVFLFMVNFVFMKSPGFWVETSLTGTNDIFGIFQQLGVKSGDTLKHGWFFGGDILKKSDSTLFIADSTACIDSHIYSTSKPEGDNCNLSNANLYNRWNVFPITVNGATKYVAFSPTWYTVSAFQVVHAFCLANKIVLIILLSSIFTTTMPLSSFAYALEDLFRPLKVFRLPTKVMALIVAISIRFVPSLIEEAFRITKAQASRGIDYKNGKLRDKANSLLSLFVPLFVISFIKAGELSEAMVSRGYNNNHPRNSYRIYIAKPWELMVMFAAMSFVACLYFLFSNSYYCGLFGSTETLAFIAR